MTSIGNISIGQAADQAAAVAASAANAAAGSAAAPSGGASTTSANALQTLGSNFNQFLSLLTTQLKNQDPTSPMDTNQFTQELVAFTGVQQSVATNTNLSQLIQLQQGSEVLQSTQVVGHTVTTSASQLALQNGAGELTFQTQGAEPVQIAIANSAGQIVRDVNLTSQSGNNTWHWDGLDNAGNKLPDGAYGAAVETASGNAKPTSVPFSVVGTATGLINTASGLQLEMGSVSVPLAKVQSISTN